MGGSCFPKRIYSSQESQIFSFQIRVVFLYWLPCILRMSRPGQESYECAPMSGGSNEKTKQMSEVELRERYELTFKIQIYFMSKSLETANIPKQTSSHFKFNT